MYLGRKRLLNSFTYSNLYPFLLSDLVIIPNSPKEHFKSRPKQQYTG